MLISAQPSSFERTTFVAVVVSGRRARKKGAECISSHSMEIDFYGGRMLGAIALCLRKVYIHHTVHPLHMVQSLLESTQTKLKFLPSHSMMWWLKIPAPPSSIPRERDAHVHKRAGDLRAEKMPSPQRHPVRSNAETIHQKNYPIGAQNRLGSTNQVLLSSKPRREPTSPRSSSGKCQTKSYPQLVESDQLHTPIFFSLPRGV